MFYVSILIAKFVIINIQIFCENIKKGVSFWLKGQYKTLQKSKNPRHKLEQSPCSKIYLFLSFQDLKQGLVGYFEELHKNLFFQSQEDSMSGMGIEADIVVTRTQSCVYQRKIWVKLSRWFERGGGLDEYRGILAGSLVPRQ